MSDEADLKLAARLRELSDFHDECGTGMGDHSDAPTYYGAADAIERLVRELAASKRLLVECCDAPLKLEIATQVNEHLRKRAAELEALVGSLSRRLCACSEALSRAAERRGLPVPEAEPGPVRSLYELRLHRLAVRARWAGCARGATK